MCQPDSAAHHRRAIIVDLALSVNGSQLIQHILPMVSFGNGKGLSTDLASGKQGAAHALVQQHQGTCGCSSRLPHRVACDMAIRPVKWPVRSTRFALTSAHNPQYTRVLWLLDLLPSPDSYPRLSFVWFLNAPSASSSSRHSKGSPQNPLHQPLHLHLNITWRKL